MKERELICMNCQQAFSVTTKKYSRSNYNFKTAGIKFYCSKKCRYLGLGRTEPKKVMCLNCNCTFTKRMCEIKKRPNNFCCQSCSTTYNNKNKTYGTRRSKLEAYIEEELKIKYSNLKFHFNCKDAINSELDIYIPSMKLAFELNGIFHYEPIYGKKKLKQIQNNDTRKFQACLEKGIELCLIDSSSLSYFKPANAKKYLDIVCEVINSKIYI